MSKYIFVTGGIVSGIGKGITSASMGFLLKSKGYSVQPVKIDPYLNQDAGTMNPFRHGEVFVTDDGAETDLDLGHYERFLNQSLSKLSNFTTGSVYAEVMRQERKGNYLGRDIQIIPHITDEIKRRILLVGKEYRPDVVTVEIGGTVGDIEGLPFIEAIRQMKYDFPSQETLYIHVVKIDYIYPSDESKTKPIQQSVIKLREYGIQPDVLIVRCKRPLTEENREKIALFCGVKNSNIIQAADTNSLYQIPINMEKEGLGKIVCEGLGLKNKKADFSEWLRIAKQTEKAKKEVVIGFLGKYLDNPDAYISVIESLKHAGSHNNVKVVVKGIDSEKADIKKELQTVDGLLVPGGFGARGIEGKISGIQFARENNLPFLGLCLGMQCATIEFARNVCGLKGAHSTEFDAKTPYPVIEYLPGQENLADKGGTMRLGGYPCKVKKGSLAKKLYLADMIEERHRHRYEVNPKYHKDLEEKGLVFSGLSPDHKLVEMVELPSHPYFIASQFHPEFKSRPIKPHPLFDGLIKAAAMKKYYDRPGNS